MLKTVSKFPVLLSRPIQYGKYSKISNSSLFLFTKINISFQSWNSQKACQHSKNREDPDQIASSEAI